MDIYEGLENIGYYPNIVIALGNFDGVHLGHRELLRKTWDIAAEQKGTPAVFTFDPHPLQVLQPRRCPPMLLTKEEKIRFFSEMGIKLLIIAPFSHEIASLSPAEFVGKVLVQKLKVSTVVVGYNFTFGKGGSGDAGLLKKLAGEHGVEVVIVPPVMCEGIEVSSTLIRQLILEGDVSRAARFLGYHPFIVSRVVCGDRRGREIGYPTANFNLPEEILVPGNGVYAVRVYVNSSGYDGIANIGARPTFLENCPRNLEVHIFDFCQDIYDAKMRVEFIERIRGEKKFASARELVTQIERDTETAKRILACHD